MAYLPSLSDLKENTSYSPSLNDLQGISNQNAQPQMVDTFFGQMPNPQNRNIIPIPSQEDYRKGSGAMLAAIPSPIKSVPIVSNLLSKIPMGTSIGNALGRIGYGTAATTAPHLFTEEDRQNLPETAQHNAMLNTALEAASYPLGRAWHGIAELFNPIKYSRNLAQKIKSEHDNAENVMKENYRPINEKYGDYNISVTPDKYLKNAGINKDNLYADAQKYYDDFINEPTYKNLLNLKSQVGRDWAKISPSNTHVRDVQLFNKYKNNLDNKIKGFLSNDKNALNQYEMANKYAENVYYPYQSTPTLKRIAKGKYDTIYPEKMANSIEKATNRVVGQDYKHRIPENHPLRNHLANLKNRLTVGDISEMALPAAAGMIGGNLLHPGFGGFAGASSGAGAGLASKLLRSKFLEYPIVQSPVVENVFKKLSPLYYGGGRAAIGQQNN
jgi:hypothetical protein